MTLTTQPQRQLVNLALIRAHLVASAVSFAAVLLGGLIFALQFMQQYPFPGISVLSPGRVRMIHTNMAAYGFIANAFIAGMLWAIPRLTKRPILSDRLGWFIFWAWQSILALTFLGILGGYAQAIEWGETPMFVDPLVLVGLVLLVANLAHPIFKTREQGLYVSLWYFLAAFAWTGLVYFMGNYVPQFWVAGAPGAAIAGLFIHDLVGLFVTPVGWGLMYFFVPLLLKKPIWSHALSLIGFWGIAFFYPMQGVHHFLWSPIPMYAQYGAVVATIAVEVVVVTVIVNFFGTLYGRADAMRANMPIRWFYVGMLGFWIMGVMVELWPKVTGRAWYSTRLLTAHFWLTTVGMTSMFVVLVAGGLVQGYLWGSLAHWGESVVYSVPFWWVRTLTGLLIITGTGLFFYNMWATARQPAPVSVPGAATVRV